MTDVVFVCTTPDSKRAESYVVKRKDGHIKWIQKEASASAFFDDLLTPGPTPDANTAFLDTVFEYVVNKKGNAGAVPRVLITFPLRRFSTPGEWQSRFRELDKLEADADIKDWALRFKASGVYIKGKRVE